MKKTHALNSSGDKINYLVQWDKNITIYLTDELLTASIVSYNISTQIFSYSTPYKVHFQSGNSTTAYSIDATYEDEKIISVVIPDEVLQTPYPITGYVCYEDDETQKTVLMFKIGIIARAESETEDDTDDDGGTEEETTTTTLLGQRITGTLTEYSSDITVVKDYAFYYYIYLETLSLSSATSIGTYAFYYCSALTSIELPVATSIDTYAFGNCSALTSVELPVATSIGTYAFYYCSALTSAELPAATSIATFAFYNCTNLVSLTLSGDTVCTLSGTSAFTNTPIASGTGYIYVPEDLVDSYKEATNWSTYADQIVAIEE